MIKALRTSPKTSARPAGFPVLLLPVPAVPDSASPSPVSYTHLDVYKRQTDDRLQVVCTIFPEYDWARQLTQGVDNVDLTLLVKNGTDLHSYQPSVRDIAMIARADVFCYVGGVSDTWVNDVLDTTENRTAQLVSMAEAADEMCIRDS